VTPPSTPPALEVLHRDATLVAVYKSAGLVVHRTALAPDADPLLDGTVTSQNPAGGAKVAFGTVVTLTVSRFDCS